MNFSLESKISIGFSIILIILTLLGYYSYLHYKNFIHASRLVSHTHKVLYHTEEILSLSLDIETGQRGYILTGNDLFLIPATKAEKEIERHIAFLQGLTADNPDQQKRMHLLKNTIQQKIIFTNTVVEISKTEGIDSAKSIINSFNGNNLMNEIRNTIATMQKEENELLAMRTEEGEQDIENFNFTFISLLICVAFIIVLIAFTTLFNLKALKEASEEVHDLYNNAPCGYHSLDADGTFVAINDTELEWLGYQRAEVEGRLKFSDLLTQESQQLLQKQFPIFKREGKVHDLEFDMMRKDGSVLPVILNSSAIYNGDGSYVKSRSTLFDNTDRKLADVQIRQLNKELEHNISRLQAVNEELESFTYSVSHDLRAPLRSIAGYAQILQEDYESSLDEEGKKTLYTVINNASRMGQLIDDLLAFSRLGKVEMVRSTVKMNNLIDPLIEELKKENTGRAIHITLHPLEPSLVDINMIKQVWYNLTSNAIKYSGKREESLIEIGSYPTEDENVYYVKDNGVGFDMQYAHKLFGVFQRLHKIKEFEGTGVGLAIVKRIVQRHGGRVWAEAVLNEGATFFFSLPKNQQPYTWKTT